MSKVSPNIGELKSSFLAGNSTLYYLQVWLYRGRKTAGCRRVRQPTEGVRQVSTVSHQRESRYALPPEYVPSLHRGDKFTRCRLTQLLIASRSQLPATLLADC
jgi:hypothetical protein